MKFFNEKQAKKALISKSLQAESLINNPDKLEEFLQKLEKKMASFPKAGKQLAYIPLFVSLIRSYMKKEYNNIPVGTIAAILCSLIYFFVLADLIPDVIPFIGYIDDIGVIAFALKMAQGDIKEYVEWRKASGKEIYSSPSYPAD